MNKTFPPIYLFLLLFNIIYTQEMIYDELNSKKLTSRQVKAVLGNDIRRPAFTTVILDASRSLPNNGSLTYEWSFSPNLFFQDDYTYDESDSMIPYTQADIAGIDPGDRTSIKKIITRNKYLELDIPDAPGGSQFDVILRVQDPSGSNDTDTMLIIVEEPIDDNFNSEFSNVSIEDQESNFSVYDESETYREPLTETVINADLLSIQPLNKGRLNPMEVDIINAFIYDFFQRRNMKNVLDPSRTIPAEMRINRLYERSRTEVDTVLMIYVDTLSITVDRSNFQNPPIDTLFNANNINDTTEVIDTSLVYRRYEMVGSTDTLYYTEVVDTVLKYNFDCKDFDCAAENAFLEQAGTILTWGINDYAELEFHYFRLKDIYDTEPISYWNAETIQFSPYADSTLRYPESIGIDPNGALVVVSGNRQSINSLGFELHPKSAINRDGDTAPLIYPAGICAGYLGEIYVTDKFNHAVHRIYEGEISTIYIASKDENGSVLDNDPSSPTSIRMDPEGNLIVLFEGDGSIHQFDSKGVRSVLLQPGKIVDPTDIALSSEGSLFVTSLAQRQVFQVAMDGSVIPVAGTTSTMGNAADGVMAVESYLGGPISIDFDALNRLYIADNVFGSIRVVTTDGIINTITDKENRVNDITQLRVNNYRLTTLYTTHTLGHKLTRIRYKTLSKNSRIEYIHYPYFIIKEEGIYGLEGKIKDALDHTLEGIVPKEKKSFFKKISESNKRFVAYLKSHPLMFGLLLLLINQGVSAVLSDGGTIDLPPDFPF
tara:strand:+ start:2663 stop:4975 length:2313 start_codon:yes stop_codon:yes gene_type:complete